MSGVLCAFCQKATLPKRHRRYCATCSPIATRIWKRRHRQQWNADWRERGKHGDPPYLDGWPSRQAFRDYYREYMRNRRQKLRAQRLGLSGGAPAADTCRFS